jgi:hypothetical protein
MEYLADSTEAYSTYTSSDSELDVIMMLEVTDENPMVSYFCII